MVIGLTIPTDFPERLTRVITERIPPALSAQFPRTSWKIVVRTEELAGPARDVDLTDVAHRTMLEEHWDLVVCLTARPLRVGRRPVTAEASGSLGVGIVSIPALGAVSLDRRVPDAVHLTIEALLCSRRHPHNVAKEHQDRMERIEDLGKLSAAVGHPFQVEQGKIAFATATATGNLRLLLGSIRGNRPWALIVGLSRSLVAAVATSVFGLTSPVIWRMADAMKYPRMIMLTATALFAIGFTLMISHSLWERAPAPHARTRVVLINLATSSTVGIGILTSYLAVMIFNLIFGHALLPKAVLKVEIHHMVGPSTYLRIAWLVSSLATFGGALGAVLEANDDVRAATFAIRRVNKTNGTHAGREAPATDAAGSKSGS